MWIIIQIIFSIISLFLVIFLSDRTRLSLPPPHNLSENEFIMLKEESALPVSFPIVFAYLVLSSIPVYVFQAMYLGKVVYYSRLYNHSIYVSMYKGTLKG